MAEISFDADIKAVLIKQMRIQNFPCWEATLLAALLRDFNYEPGKRPAIARSFLSHLFGKALLHTHQNKYSGNHDYQTPPDM